MARNRLRITFGLATLLLLLVLVESMGGGLVAIGGGRNPALGRTPTATQTATTPGQPSTGIADDGGGPQFEIRFAPTGPRRGLNYSAAQNKTGAIRMLSDVGVYAVDFDNDGWIDVLATGGSSPVLFRNVNGTFRPSGALPPINRSIRAALFLDYDNDDWSDLLLLSDNRTPLLLENVRGNYRRVDGGFERELTVPIGASAADYNRDGCLDLFVIQNGRWTDHIPRGFQTAEVPVAADNGEPNVLYEGTCSGFDRRTNAGIEGMRWSLATSFTDLNGDGWPDIHVANDFNNDILYLNDRNGGFEQVVLPESTDRNGMSSEIADVNGDGRLDIFVTNIFYPPIINETLETKFAVRAKGNNLLINRGNGTFVDRAGEYGVRKGGWGWAAVIADLDNDGDQDLVHATKERRFDKAWMKFTREEETRIRKQYPYFRYPVLRERTADGFAQVSAAYAGLNVNDGTGVIEFDFDRDGDLDLLSANRTGRFILYENRADNNCDALAVSISVPQNRTEWGTTVTVTAGSWQQTRRVHAGTDFLSQDPRRLHFGVGPHDRVEVRIEWPDGTVTEIGSVRPGRRIVISPDGMVATVSFRYCDG